MHFHVIENRLRKRPKLADHFLNCHQKLQLVAKTHQPDIFSGCCPSFFSLLDLQMKKIKKFEAQNANVDEVWWKQKIICSQKRKGKKEENVGLSCKHSDCMQFSPRVQFADATNFPHH